jgi:hypothetical protein
MTSFHSELIAATAAERGRFLSLPILADAQRGAVSHAEYLEFLRRAWHHVRHTLPLLMACGSRLPDRLEWLQQAVAEYIEEECGHQHWIVNDIRAAGGDPDALLAEPVPAEVELMVAYAYDGIARNSPLSFFGMVLVLEGTSAALATHAAEALMNSLQLPEAAFSYLLSHGSLDQQHIGFFENLMNRLTDPSDQAAVIHAARRFYSLYGGVFAGIRQPLADLAEAA